MQRRAADWLEGRLGGPRSAASSGSSINKPAVKGPLALSLIGAGASLAGFWGLMEFASFGSFPSPVAEWTSFAVLYVATFVTAVSLLIVLGAVTARLAIRSHARTARPRREAAQARAPTFDVLLGQGRLSRSTHATLRGLRDPWLRVASTPDNQRALGRTLTSHGAWMTPVGALGTIAGVIGVLAVPVEAAHRKSWTTDLDLTITWMIGLLVVGALLAFAGISLLVRGLACRRDATTRLAELDAQIGRLEDEALAEAQRAVLVTMREADQVAVATTPTPRRRKAKTA